jgi:hypothetical protein
MRDGRLSHGRVNQRLLDGGGSGEDASTEGVMDAGKLEAESVVHKNPWNLSDRFVEVDQLRSRARAHVGEHDELRCKH